MFKEEILENENRRRIYATIERSPGVHLRELQRILNMPLTTLEYHLSYMVRKKILYSENDAYYKRYYVKPLGDDDKKVLSALRQKRLRDIVLLVLSNGKAKYQYMSDQLRIPNSTLSFYLKYLVKKEILLKERVGYETIYVIKDEEKVVKVLTTYKISFLDKLVDKALAMWLETYTRK